MTSQLGIDYSVQRAKFEAAFKDRFGDAYAEIALRQIREGVYDIPSVNELAWFYDQGRIDESDFIESIIANRQREYA